MACLKQDINDEINEIGYNEHCIMTVQDVVEAVSRIKSGKHDGYLVYPRITLSMHATNCLFICLRCSRLLLFMALQHTIYHRVLFSSSPSEG
jgi:hypothetical protein